jgi:hypothetical protein
VREHKGFLRLVELWAKISAIGYCVTHCLEVIPV